MLARSPGGAEVIIDHAAAYWLEGAHGDRLSPESERTLGPFSQALALVEAGTPPEALAVWSRLDDGRRYRVAGGIDLLGLAEAAAGIPRSHADPMPPRVRREIEEGLRDADGYLLKPRRH